jgi:hypothetical protein
MAWSVHARQIKLAAQQTRRQLVVTGGTDAAENGSGGPAAAGAAPPANGAGPAAPVVIEGLDTLVAGDQARYRVRPGGNRTVESWAVGGGAVTQAPDPSHPDELLLIADEPGSLTIMVRVREGMTERRGIKSVTAVPDVTAAAPAPLRLFLHGWGLVAVAVLIIGFAGALDALGTLASADFIALGASLVAVLAVTGVARASGDQGGGHASSRKGGSGPAP